MSHTIHPLELKDSLQKEDTEIANEAIIAENLDVVLDPKKEKKLLAKLDLAFVPIITLTYLTCFLDRSNIGRPCWKQREIELQAHTTPRKCQSSQHA